MSMTWKGLFGIKSKTRNIVLPSDVDAIFNALYGRSMFVEIIFRLLERLSLLNYALLLLVWTFSQRYQIIFRGYRVWIPAPSIPLTSELSGVFLVNFWDPFVFYYRDFDDIFKYVYFNTLRLLRRPGTFVVTQSEHNKGYLTRVMKIPSERVVVIRNGSPDYQPMISKSLLMELDQYDFCRPVEYKKIVMKELNDIVTNLEYHSLYEFSESIRNLNILDRLYNEISHNTKIIFISTQLRPYKGVQQIYKIFDQLVNSNPDLDFRFIVTFKLSADIKNRYFWAKQRTYEILRTPNSIHAHLYLLADLVIHPSYNEGGVGAYPAYEGTSLRVPVIMNNGPHTQELLSDHPNCSAAIFYIDDSDDACRKILQLISDGVLARENINYVQASSISWADASNCYQQLFKPICRNG